MFLFPYFVIYTFQLFCVSGLWLHVLFPTISIEWWFDDKMWYKCNPVVISCDVPWYLNLMMSKWWQHAINQSDEIVTSLECIKIMICTKNVLVNIHQNTIYSKPSLMWPYKGKIRRGHIRQIVTKYRLNWYEMYCEGISK